MSEKAQRKDIFETLILTREEYLLSQEEEKNISEEMKKKLIEAEREIKNIYQSKISLARKKSSTLIKDLENSKKLLEIYSTFDAEMIGNIVEKLITLVEGEEYSYQKADHETYEYKSTVFGNELFKTNKKLLMIVKGNNKHGYYRDYDEQNNEVYKLIKDGQAFILSKSELNYNNQITFFTANQGMVKDLIDFNKFSYVKSFINLVVQYRFENQLEKISEKELLRIMNEFILSEKDMIEEKYKKLAMEKQEKLRQQLIDEQLKNDIEIELTELETLMKNGVPMKYSNNLIDRLREIASNNSIFDNAMWQFEILYETEKHPAKIIYNKPLVSSENIFISKINIESSIKDYFDDSSPDIHFHGECNIDLVDDGLIGIVEISSLNQDISNIVNSTFSHEFYKIDRINNKYLRILYLPNKGKYTHKSINVYNWIIEGILDKQDKNLNDKTTSYKTEWNINEESEKMLTFLKEIELTSHLTEKQLKLYRQRKR